MSASHYDGHSRAALRIGLALIVALVLLNEVVGLCDLIGHAPVSARHTVLATLLPASTGGAWSCFAIGLMALLPFAAARRPVLSGSVVLVAMAFISQWSTELFG